jgi:hypothetical protein
MSIISTSDFTGIADNIAKSLLDLEAAFITNPGVNAPTKSTITAGQNGASSSLHSRVAALDDIGQEADLAQVTVTTTAAVVSYLTDIVASDFYALYRDIMNALESHTGGLSSYISTNSLQVHPEFAAAFNQAANSPTLGTVFLTNILPANIFIPAMQTLGSILVSGSAAGTFAGGTPIDSTKYAPAALFLKNIGGSLSGGTTTSFSVTYKNASGSNVTATVSLSGALASGASLSLGLTGYSVSAISVTANGVSSDNFAIVVNPLRNVTY